MINQKPKVSVIMPVYNSGIYLRTAINSILRQTLYEFELIIVDDGSTDGSSEICDSFAIQDQRVKVLHQKNQGICTARNNALILAKGEYVAFSDHDDEYHKDLLHDNYLYAKYNDLDFLKFCREEIRFDKNNKIYKKSKNITERKIYYREDVESIFYDFFENKLNACVWDGLFKREFLEKFHIKFDPYFKMGGEDYIFNLECLANSHCFGTNDRCYYYHYMRDSFSTSTKIDPNRLMVLKKIFVKSLKVLELLDASPNNSRIKYTHFFIKEYLAPVMTYLIKRKTNVHAFCKYLDQIKSETGYETFMNITYLSLIHDTFYSIVHRLYKKSCYKTLYFIYIIKTK